MKIKLYMVFLILLIPLATAIKECQPMTSISGVPCTMVTTWNYTPPCSAYTAIIYNSSRENIINYTYSDYVGGLCVINWTITKSGSYSGIVSNGDTLNIEIGTNDMTATITLIGFLVLINLILFIAPLYLQIKNEVNKYLVQRALWIISLVFLWYNFGLMIGLNTIMELGVTENLKNIFIIFSVVILLTIFYLVYLCFHTPLKMMRDIALKKIMGD